MSDEGLSPAQISAITAYVDIEASPPDEPAAHLLFGTDQAQPAAIAAERYHRGLAPMLIATGGVNRHTGIVEGREFARLLTTAGVPEHVIRVEDQSADTWQNVERSLPSLREALAAGLRLTVVSKWYHRRAVHALRTLLPQAGSFYAISWEPVATTEHLIALKLLARNDRRIWLICGAPPGSRKAELYHLRTSSPPAAPTSSN